MVVFYSCLYRGTLVRAAVRLIMPHFSLTAARTKVRATKIRHRQPRRKRALPHFLRRIHHHQITAGAGLRLPEMGPGAADRPDCSATDVPEWY